LEQDNKHWWNDILGLNVETLLSKKMMQKGKEENCQIG
jgi:hypothetical protein